MADDDNVRITATRPARRRALPGVRTGEIPLGTIPDVIVCGHRRTLIPGSRRGRLTQNRVARKWRRNGLKRLNPRPEMVWARTPRTYYIWYPGARLTARLRVTSCESTRGKSRNATVGAGVDCASLDRGALGKGGASRRTRSTRASTKAASQLGSWRGNFPPCNALKTHETGKESRFCAGPLRRAGGTPRGRGGAVGAPRDPGSRPRSGVDECRRPARSRHNRVMAPARPRGKFSSSQSLENSQNGARIATRCLEPQGSFPSSRAGRGATPAPCKFVSPYWQGNRRAGRQS